MRIPVFMKLDLAMPKTTRQSAWSPESMMLTGVSKLAITCDSFDSLICKQMHILANKKKLLAILHTWMLGMLSGIKS